MLRTMMTGKIHRATVTQADLHYVGSVTVDEDLLDAADLLAGELVHIVDVTNGARLETYTIAGERGSGVLGIAATRLGAAAAHCFDIDPQALLATRENAAANESHVSTYATADELPGGVDILVANILSGPLCELAPLFGSLVRTGGAIVLAGLLEHEAADVTEAHTTWFDIHPFEVREGWSGLAGLRR